MTAAVRDHKTAVVRMRAALEKGPWIMGKTFSAADLLLHGPYVWFPDAMPQADCTAPVNRTSFGSSYVCPDRLKIALQVSSVSASTTETNSASCFSSGDGL